MAQRIKLKKEPCLDAKYDAFPFQKEAVDFASPLEYSAIFYEQGLGKTKIAIDLIRDWLERKIVDTVIVVTKKGLLENWKQEFKGHSYLKPRMLTSNKSMNYSVLNSASRVLLCNFEVFTCEPRLKKFLQLRDVAVIVDESAKLKNPTAALTKKFYELAPLFKKRIIMTGTPIPNRPEDIWAQIYFLDHGTSLGTDFNTFKRDVKLSNSLSDNKEEQAVFEKELGAIFPKLKSFCIRETKQGSGLSLPNKEYQNISCDWERRQFELYQKVREEERYAIIRDGEFNTENAEALLKRLLRLLQVASNPLLIDESYDQMPGKFNQLHDLLALIRSQKEKCIIWTSFVKNAEWLKRSLKEYRAVLIHGGVSIEDRNRAIERFKHDDSVGVLVAVPAAAKEGLTLTVANHVIFWDRSFSLDDYLQAQDRIHRISQTRACYIYNLLMDDSIDDWVNALLEAKEQAAKLIQEDISIIDFHEDIDYSFGYLMRQILGIGDDEVV
jgi:SNF2 family DNA or RNA helicase